MLPMPKKHERFSFHMWIMYMYNVHDSCLDLWQGDSNSEIRFFIPGKQYKSHWRWWTAYCEDWSVEYFSYVCFTGNDPPINIDVVSGSNVCTFCTCMCLILVWFYRFLSLHSFLSPHQHLCCCCLLADIVSILRIGKFSPKLPSIATHWSVFCPYSVYMTLRLKMSKRE